MIGQLAASLGVVGPVIATPAAGTAMAPSLCQHGQLGFVEWTTR